VSRTSISESGWLFQQREHNPSLDQASPIIFSVHDQSANRPDSSSSYRNHYYGTHRPLIALNLGAKINSSLTRFQNDNTLALAHLNLDFSLIKVVVPEEYKSLGINLSSPRRETAEEGLQHRTARKLGALFERLLPDSPHLVRAYGKRCSKIARHTELETKLKQNSFCKSYWC
jgi:hypothetical protein